MSVDRSFLGHSLPSFTVTITPERLAKFAEAIGERNPAFARDTLPPTFLKVIEGEGGSSRRILDDLKVDLKRILHAEQQFEYFAPIRAGDTISVQRKVADLYEKKGGEMEFIVIETSFAQASGQVAAISRQIVLIRNAKREN